MILLDNRVLIITLSALVIHSNQTQLKNDSDVSVSPSNDELSKFEESLNSLHFEKIGSDFTSDDDDLLRWGENEDQKLNGYELLTKYGVIYETYVVETSDGYRLKLVRIPGKGASVLIVHGLLSSWEDFITPGPDHGLPYLLARKGYDVWLVNCRGNKFSRNHITLSPKNKEFWDFSWHEIGTRDVPATVDKILSVTGKKKIIYIGHSQGTTAGFVWLSQLPDYNDKVTLMVSLAPVGYLNHVESPVIQIMIKYMDKLEFLLNLFGHGEFMPSNWFIYIAANVMCFANLTPTKICNNILFLMYGFDKEQVNKTSFPVEFDHTPAGAATKQLLHYGQEAKSGKFRQYDYGKELNLNVYKSEEPPNYNMSKIVAPVAFYYGKNDWLADVADVERLAEEIPNLVEKYLVRFNKFNHADFLWAKDVIPLLYDRVFELLKRYA